jgi:hypothetical protein
VKTDRSRHVAAGKVLEALGQDAKIASVHVDGKKVDVDKARSTLVDAERLPPEKPVETAPNVFQRVTKKVGDKIDGAAEGLQGKVDSMTESLSKYKAGRAINALLQSDPEKVQQRHTVDVVMANGTAFSLHVDVKDARATAFLQRCSLAAEVGSLVPALGTLGLAGASAVSLVASVVAVGMRDTSLAKALVLTAAKHLVLAGADIIPLLGDAAAAIAAVIDSKNLKGVKGAPTVAQIVDLAALVEAQGGTAHAAAS